MDTHDLGSRLSQYWCSSFSNRF